MNLLNFELGGWKFYTNDLNYLQGNVKAMFEAYLSRFTVVRSSFIYSGCSFTFNSAGNAIECSEGWVVVDGELLKFNAQSVSPATLETTYTFVLNVADNPDGVKLDDDGNTIEAWKTRTAVLQEIVSTNNATDSYVSFEDGVNRLWRLKDVVEGKNISVPMQAGWSLASPLYYRKDIDGIVTVNGATVGASNATGSIMATLPDGFKPEVDVNGVYSTGSKLYPCIIRDWGAVFVNFGSDPRADGRFIIPSYKGV